MLNIHDILGFTKRGYDFSSYQQTESLPTLADLVMEVQRDRGLSDVERVRLLTQLRALVGGAPASASLSSLMYKGLGGTLGYLISKYFGMGMTGKLLSAAAGFGIGKVLFNKLNTPPDPYKGYKLLG
jgi:hypothetical protein